MSQKLDASPAVIGIDIGKNSFHIVGHNQRGAIVLASLGIGLLRFPHRQPGESGLRCRAGGGGRVGVPYVELGRRDVHHDGWAHRLCCVLHCAALDGVTLSTFRPLR